MPTTRRQARGQNHEDRSSESSAPDNTPSEVSEQSRRSDPPRESVTSDRMSEGMEDARAMEDARINALTGQALSDAVKEARERHKEDLKRRFLSQLAAGEVPEDSSFLRDEERERKRPRKHRPKLEIPPFKGESYMDWMRFDQVTSAWIASYEDEFPDEVSKVLLLVPLFSERLARKWTQFINTEHGNNVTNITYEETRAWCEGEVGDASTRSWQAVNSLYGLAQAPQQTLRAFMIRFEDVMNSFPDPLPEKFRIYFFIRCTLATNHRILLSDTTNTWEELRAKVIRVDAVNANSRGTPQNPQTPTSPALPSAPPTTPGGGGAANSTQKPMRGLENVTCYRCGERGHLSTTCSQPRPNCGKCGQSDHTTGRCVNPPANPNVSGANAEPQRNSGQARPS